ncbi:uncharacterized protein LOC143421099 [Maylandia zebra]|uniref:uncharacterized protein LOC143421099 n=1 Tax=Maylandia zebra TaxID=106582 RepID=UPI00403C0362
MRLLTLLKVGFAVAVTRKDGRSVNITIHGLTEQTTTSVMVCSSASSACSLLPTVGTKKLKNDIIIWLPQYDYQTLDYDITLAKIYQPSEVIEAVILIPSPTCWTKKTNK